MQLSHIADDVIEVILLPERSGAIEQFVRLFAAERLPTLRTEPRGGSGAEADAARPLPRRTRKDTNRDLQRPCRRDSCVLTSRLGRRASAGP